MKRSWIRAKIKPRLPEVSEYHSEHPNCRVCGRPARGVHHINHDRKSTNEKEFETLCDDHHTGNRGVHTIGDVAFCEQNGLTQDPKWRDRYQRLKDRQEYSRKMREGG